MLVLAGLASASAPVQVETMYYRGKAPQGHVVGDNEIAMPRVRSVSGVYFYDRVRKAIQLSGRTSGDTLELKEQEGGGEPKAKLALTIKSNRLEGSWEGAKKYAVELTP